MKSNTAILTVLLGTVLIISSGISQAQAADSAKADKSADEKTLIDIEYQWANAYVSGNADKLFFDS